MKNGKGLGRANSVFEGGEAKKGSAHARITTDSADALVLLEQSPLTVVELTQALAENKKHLYIPVKAATCIHGVGLL